MVSASPCPLAALRLLSASVKGMRVWDPNKFNVTINVPAIIVHLAYIDEVKKKLKHSLLRVRKMQHIEKVPGDPVRKWLLLNPDKVKSVRDLSSEIMQYFKEPLEDPLPEKEVTLTLRNWPPTEMLNAVLEDVEPGVPGLKSFAIIGHIAHVNLKEHHIPYKHVIGEIILSGVPQVCMVVNKTNTIDNTFRNFAMEVLAGDEKSGYNVEVRENGCLFRFDFSAVYWNPRLSTEHTRLVEMLAKEDCLLDVFAGVGPFAVPAGKRCAKVIANDLNPLSAEALRANVKTNKVVDKVVVTNKDGRLFIREDVKEALLQFSGGQIHIAMNLPAMAIEFLDTFRGLMATEDATVTYQLPTVHVYAFTKCEENGPEDVKKRSEEQIGASLEDVTVHFVRNVAPNKDMYRVSFQVPDSVLRKDIELSEANPTEPKRRKVEEELLKEES